MTVHLPDQSLEFVQGLSFAAVPVTTLMNYLAFGSPHSEKFDANFITRLDKSLVSYHVQKLAGIEMENEDLPASGKNWVLYVDNVRYDWNAVCRQELEVTPLTSIEWKFE